MDDFDDWPQDLTALGILESGLINLRLWARTHPRQAEDPLFVLALRQFEDGMKQFGEGHKE